MLNYRWIVFFIELVLNARAADLAEWSVIPSSSLPRLPRPEYGAALCVLNESMQTLHILGGKQNQRRWVEYHVADDTFIDHGDNAMPSNIAAVSTSTPIREHSANYWTQLNGVLYYILNMEDGSVPFDQRKHEIHSVNANAIGEPNSMQYWQTVPYATQSHDHCIASYAHKLIVVGGMQPGLVYQGVANMAVYDFTTQQWMTGPSMKQPRQEPSCVVNTAENAFYVSGGFHDSVPLDSIEKVSLTDIASQSWDYIAGSLTVAMYGHVMVYYPDDNTILVIGGWDHSIARAEIQRIDCETGAVTVIGALEIAVARSAFVYIAHLRRIYLFGGKVADGQGTDHMQIIRALVPTNEPSASPSSYPSETPTPMPSSSLSAPPTPYPSVRPSSCSAPSEHPTTTSAPTLAPSNALSAITAARPSLIAAVFTNKPSTSVSTLPTATLATSLSTTHDGSSLQQQQSPMISTRTTWMLMLSMSGAAFVGCLICVVSYALWNSNMNKQRQQAASELEPGMAQLQNELPNVVPGDDDDQSDNAVVIRVQLQREDRYNRVQRELQAQKEFVYDPNNNYKPEGARASVLSPGGDHGGEESESSKTSSSDSSFAMHEDHWAVLKVTNFQGIDDAQKLQILETHDNGEQNVEHAVNGSGTKGTNM